MKVFYITGRTIASVTVSDYDKKKQNKTKETKFSDKGMFVINALVLS